MVIAIHQPNYLPWPGYFYKIYAADEFIFLDDVPYSKGSYTNRARVQMYDNADVEPRWLTVPLEKFELGTAISQLTIADPHWYRQHLSIISAYYRNAPFYEEVTQLLNGVIQEVERVSELGEVNILLIRTISDYLGIKTQWLKASELNSARTGEDRISELVKKAGGSTYLSGTGAHAYQTAEHFKEKEVELVYHNMSGWLEEEVHGEQPGFGNLSILDTLMHRGREGLLELFKSFESDRRSHLRHDQVHL